MTREEETTTVGDQDPQTRARRPVSAGGEMDRLTLRFADRKLETGYQKGRLDRVLRQLRLSFIVAIAVNLSFAAMEPFVLSQNFGLVMVLRLTGGVAIFVLAFGLSYLEFVKQHLLWLAAPLLIGFTVSYVAIIYYSNAPDIYISGYVLAILFTFYLVPLGFFTTSVLALLVTLGFATVTTLILEIPAGTRITLYGQYAAALSLGMVALYWLERLQRRDFLNLQEIASGRSRHQNLLNRILPASIVERIDQGEAEIADEFAESTVLFADIVGFTDGSGRHSPAQVLALLNRTFRAFDELVAKHKVEKIKTIGDAYMVAGGLPQERPGHGEAIANLALEMMQEVAGIQWPDGTPVNLRIGIHTGPLVAGVIGDSRFVYDLWGDTVNIASRMESLGKPGRIQVSQRFHELQTNDFAFEPHGEIEVKGAGRMKTWFLTG